MGDVAFIPSMGAAASKLTADELFESNANFVFLNINRFNSDVYENFNINRNVNFIVDIKENATTAEKDEILNYLSRYGIYATYDEIIQNTNDAVDEEIRENFPLPVFLLLISTVSMICVSAVAIQRSMHEHSIYYLIGCSKKRSITTIILSLLLLFCIPCIMNLLLAFFWPNFLRTKVLSQLII